MIDALDLLEIGKTKILKPDSLYKNKTGFLEEKNLAKNIKLRYKIITWLNRQFHQI